VLVGRFGIDSSWAEELAEADSTAGFSRLLDRIKSLPQRHQDRLKEILLSRWTALDPAGGVAFFQSGKDEEGLSGFFREWQRNDFPAAVARAEELDAKFFRRTLRDKALTDPAGLLAWLTGRPDLNPLSLFDSGNEENTKALIRLAEADPDKMLSWTRQLPEDKWDAAFLKGLAARLAANGADDAAVTWAKSIRDSGKSAAALTGIAGELAAASPERAVSLLASLPETGNYEDRSRLLEVIQKLDVSDAAKARALAKTMPPGEARSLLLRRTMMTLMGTDPAAAFALPETEKAGLGAEWFRGSLSPEAKTPEGARRILEAAADVADSAYCEAVTKDALLNWQQKDPASLAAWLKETGDTPLIAGLRKEIQKALAVQQWRDGAADPGLLAIVGMPPEILVESQSLADPAAAAGGLEKVEDPAARQRLAGDIAKQYVWQNRAQAIAWAETAKDPETQGIFWKTIAEDWVKEDSWQASQWIAKLPEGKGRDSAVLAMAGGISKTDPDLAWQWALSMGDPALKNEALSAAARDWMKKDSAALQQALGSDSLAPAERQAVLETLKNAVAKAGGTN
jgi:hypothetical protein